MIDHMPNDVAIDAFIYLCGKLGFEVVRLNTSGASSLRYLRLFGHAVGTMSCESNYYRSTRQFGFFECDAYEQLETFLNTRTFCIDGFKGRIANPFYMHLELLKCKTTEEMYVTADLAFPDDISKKVVDFFKKEEKQ